MTHTVENRYRLHHLYRGQGGGAAEGSASDNLVPAVDHRTARCARRPVSRIRHLHRPSRKPLAASSRVIAVSLAATGPVIQTSSSGDANSHAALGNRLSL